MNSIRGIAVAVGALALLAASAQGTVIVTANHSDYTPGPGQSLDNIRMGVDLVVSGGLATFTFSNLSLAPETSAVIKEIVLDTRDDDTGVAFLWSGTVLTHTNDVRFDIGTSNGLPGFGDEITDRASMAELSANSPPTKRGLGVGESLQVRFNTNLGDGSSIEDYLAAFGGGQDSSQWAIGFHAINAGTVGGQSLSGAFFAPPPSAVPEPTTTALLVLGGSLALVRRRNRRLAL